MAQNLYQYTAGENLKLDVLTGIQSQINSDIVVTASNNGLDAYSAVQVSAFTGREIGPLDPPIPDPEHVTEAKDLIIYPADQDDYLTTVRLKSDVNFKSENIRKNVKIYDVVGSYEGNFLNAKTITVRSSEIEQRFYPSSVAYQYDYTNKVIVDCDYFDKVIIAINPLLNDKELTPRGIDVIRTLQDCQPNYAFGQITINEIRLQDIRVSPRRYEQTVTADENIYTGLGTVVVEGSSALSPHNIRQDVEIFGVKGTYVPRWNIGQSYSQTVTGTNRTYIIPEYNSISTTDGFLSINITVDVQQAHSGEKLGLDPLISGSYNPSNEGYTSWSKITINEVPHLENLLPDNIRYGETIFGVTGTYGAKPIDITPDVEFDDTLIDNNFTHSVKTSYDEDVYKDKYVITHHAGLMFRQIKITKDSNLIPGNIRYGQTIYGVTGTLQNGMHLEDKQPPFVPTFSNNSGYASYYYYDVQLNEGREDSYYDSFSKVTIKKHNKFKPEYIKKNVEIFGVKGTFTGFEISNVDIYPTIKEKTYSLTDLGCQSWQGIKQVTIMPVERKNYFIELNNLEEYNNITNKSDNILYCILKSESVGE